ncbi:hypothetical protein AVEN_185545-1 [Araneus ventricosus]|uniref:Uncharacterized protein n=1 Tax=Araneus ventricosus TaxID=182803 RepID=A0A4Y2NWB9_ARAVE|nr:hypothetical protein AVEN_185545-1 [Araneus ventricosus]
MLNSLKQPESQNPHMAFFQGEVPHLNKFDDGEFLEFQMTVLQATANIKEKKGIQPPVVPYHPHHFAVPYQQQTSSIRNPQPSFNPPFSVVGGGDDPRRSAELYQVHEPVYPEEIQSQ